jgi:amino acid transporter|nr:APC family permease [uncultured Schaedlerella sp.]
MEKQKKLKLFDIICLSFASFFSIELVASQATLGPSMIFSMLLFGGLYLICHGLICAEMGAAYPDQGGIYVWTLQAFGNKWAARTTWWYWANVVAFVPCTMVALVVVFQQLFWQNMSVITTTLICIAGTWIAVFLNCMSLEDSKLLSNTGSVLKLVVCLALIGGGIYTFTVSGSQNIFSTETVIPKFDMQLFALLPVYIYGLNGMDVISCNSGEMENPKRDVPKALLITGIISITIYILCAISILVILPQAEIDSASGMIDAIISVFGGSRIVAVLIGIALVFVYASYIFGWTIGGNSAALEAGEAGELPGWFAKSNEKHAPAGPAVLLGIASTVLLLFYGFTASSSSELFWTLLAFTSIIFFLPYVVLSFSFLRLRKIDPDTYRPFKIPGKIFPSIIAVLNFILLVIAIIGYLLPPEGENPVTYVLFLAAGLAVTQILGEFLIWIAAKNHKTN